MPAIPRPSKRYGIRGFVLSGVCAIVACKVLSSSSSPADPAAPQPTGTLHPLDNAPADAAPDVWIDCVGVLHVVQLRGVQVANAQRFGGDSGALRTTSRIADLSLPDLRALCDWEACVRSNGYAHDCALNDGGWESCRVCTGPADCDGRPLSQADCVAHATDPGRAACHVGLLQECLLQQALRGPADPRVTQSCSLSQQACAGDLPGDLSTQALAAQHETDQVTIEEFKNELAIEAKVNPDSGYVIYWEQQLALWDGGVPPGEGDAADGGPLDASAGE